MEKNEYLENLQLLVGNEEPLSVSRDVNELKAKFEDFILEEERLRQVAYLEAQERGENHPYEDQIADPIRKEFEEIYDAFKKSTNELRKQRKEISDKNFALKKSLLTRLRELMQNEENIKNLYDQSTDINEKWKSIAAIDRDRENELQSEYSQLRDAFFTNLQIFKELREYDLKKNLEVKEEISNKVKSLLELDDVKTMEDTLRALRNQFDETGPVPKDDWERIRDTYWENVRLVYQKIHDFYEGKKELLKENIVKKTALLEKVTEFVTKSTQLKTPKDWDNATKELIAFQEEWKNIGYGTKKENEQLWKSFRVQCDAFFNNKRTVFEELKKGFAENLSKKRAIIDQINHIKSDTNWKETTEKILKLQKEWKKVGHAGNVNEQKLWKEFRGACDEYFAAKDEFFKERNDQEEENLKNKQALIEEIKAYKTPEDKNQLIADMKDFAKKFSLTGRVPFKEKETIYTQFKAAIDQHYKDLNLNEDEKAKVLFQAEVDTIKASPNASKLIENKRNDIRKEIKTLEQEVIQYENNLGFFNSKSKSPNPLLMQAENKVKNIRQKIDNLKLKLKQLHE